MPFTTRVTLFVKELARKMGWGREEVYKLICMHIINLYTIICMQACMARIIFQL